jgi:hypothetical protein
VASSVTEIIAASLLMRGESEVTIGISKDFSLQESQSRDTAHQQVVFHSNAEQEETTPCLESLGLIIKNHHRPAKHLAHSQSGSLHTFSIK